MRLHFEMLRIRVVETTLAELYKEQEMRTPAHFSVGQEAIAVGVCAALERDDVVYSGHRCHAHYLAKGGDLAALVAELYGRETGCARGRGGSVHLTDPEVGLIASSAILAQTVPVAVGSALAFKMDGSRRVAVTFFGDGAIDEGVFHESLNWASVRRLPVLFVCENNLYATHSPLSVRLPQGTRIDRRAGAYRIASERIDGNDLVAVYRATMRAVARCRRGEGPAFLECMTYRWLEHVGPGEDFRSGYRSVDEARPWMDNDQLQRTAALLPKAQRTTIEQQVEDEVADALAFADASPFPTDEELWTHVYAD